MWSLVGFFQEGGEDAPPVCFHWMDGFTSRVADLFCDFWRLLQDVRHQSCLCHESSTTPFPSLPFSSLSSPSFPFTSLPFHPSVIVSTECPMKHFHCVGLLKCHRVPYTLLHPHREREREREDGANFHSESAPVDPGVSISPALRLGFMALSWRGDLSLGLRGRRRRQLPLSAAPAARGH